MKTISNQVSNGLFVAAYHIAVYKLDISTNKRLLQNVCMIYHIRSDSIINNSYFQFE